MVETKKLVLVRTCTTSIGEFIAEVPGGTKDSEVLELPAKEVEDLIAQGFGRYPPAHLIDGDN